jgi:integrase/recombinase XerD
MVRSRARVHRALAPSTRQRGYGLLRAGVDINTIRAWLGHVSIDTTNVYAEVDLETKAQMLAACGSFTAGKATTRRWQDDPSLMQFLGSL